MGIEGIYLNIIKAIDEKYTAKIILKGENLTAFPLRSGRRQSGPLLFNIVLEVLATAIREEKDKKKNPNWKRRKLPLFEDVMIPI